MSMKLFYASAILLVTLVSAVFDASATTRRVPSDYNTIQEAIDQAVDGDTILVADGIYRGDGNRDIVLGPYSLVIRSESGPAACIIDCEGDTGSRHNAFNLLGLGSTNEIEVCGFTVINGYREIGGALEVNSSTIDLRDCVFFRNHAIAMGGALFLYRSDGASITNCLFVENTSQEGTATFVSTCSPDIVQSAFINNGNGAQIVTENYAYPSIRFSLFVGNTVFSQPACCDWAPIVGPSGSYPQNCVRLLYDTYDDLWGVDETGYFDIDPLICYQDSVGYKVGSTSPCLPENNQFNTRIGYTVETCSPTGVDQDDDLSAVPRSPALYQNYPNPFNPSTTIEFDLTRRSLVTITVYNALGRQVRELVREQYPGGEYRIEWDGRNEFGVPVSSGVYFYTIQAGDFTASRKMLLLK